MDVVQKTSWIMASTVILFSSSSLAAWGDLTISGGTSWVNASLQRIESKQVELSKQLLELLSGGVTCDEAGHWRLFDNKKCIVLLLNKMDYAAGMATCGKFSGPKSPAKVLSIQSQKENDWVRKFVTNSFGHSVTDTYWLDPEGQDNNSFAAWGNGFPSNVYGYDCIQLSRGNQWRNVACTDKSRVLCERVPFSLLNPTTVIDNKDKDMEL